MTTKKQNTYQYHFVVCVDVVVDEDGKVVSVDAPFIEDVVPVDDDRMVYSEYEYENDPIGDGWVGESPADRDEDGNYTGNGWHAATNAVGRLLAADPMPLCGDCEKPICGEPYIIKGEPWCGDCAEADYLHRMKVTQ